MPDFDINTIDESQREAFNAYVQSQVTIQNKALETNRDEVLGKYTTTKDSLATATGTLEQYKTSFGEMTPEEIQELVAAKKNGDVEKLLGEGKLKEAAEAQANHAIKEQQRQWDAKFKSQTDQYAELEAKYTESDKQNRENRLGKYGVEAFMKLDDHGPTAVGDVHTAVLANFQLDANGDPVMYEKDGKTIALDQKGQPKTIEYFVNEDLRASKPHYFVPKQGSDAKGSGGGGNASDFGLGIKQRKGVSDELRNKFFNKAAEKGIDNPRERWENEIPWEAT